MAKLTFYTGTMGAGKSTLALQMNHNLRNAGRKGMLFTSQDRSGKCQITSRLGIFEYAHDIDDLHVPHPLDYMICDEAQFYTPAQIDTLSTYVILGIDIHTFGILTDFQSKLFPGSARLVELADDIVKLPAEALCWCGKVALHNARVIDGSMAIKGDQIVVGNTDDGAVHYRTLCRQHYLERRIS